MASGGHFCGQVPHGGLVIAVVVGVTTREASVKEVPEGHRVFRPHSQVRTVTVGGGAMRHGNGLGGL